MEAQRAPSGIQVNRLGDVSPEHAGPLSPATGGLPADLWAATPAGTVADLIGLLPPSPSSPGARDLQRRLLLTNASLASATGGAGGGSSGVLEARLDALAEMGENEGLSRVLDLVPRDRRTDAIDRLAVDRQLRADRVDEACLLADSRLAQSSDRFWQRILVFCQQRAGQIDKVEFGIRLLQELGDENERFFALMGALTEGKAPRSVPTNEPYDGLDIAMARAAGVGLPLPDGPIEDASVEAFLDAPGTAYHDRLEIAEAAEARGLITTDRLIGLYGGVEVRADMLESALSVAENDPSPHSRALLYRATISQTVPVARAQAIHRAFDLARRNGRTGQAARLYAPIIADLEPSNSFGWFAVDAATALHVTGRHEAARRWTALAKAEAGRSDPLRAAWVRAWPTLRLAGGENAVPWETRALDAWWSEIRTEAPERAVDRAASVFALLTALGEPLGDGVWRELAVATAGAPETPGGDGRLSLFALDAAAAAGRVGETVVFALALLDEAAVERDLYGTARALGALGRVGLATEARRIAVEIALDGGL